MSNPKKTERKQAKQREKKSFRQAMVKELREHKIGRASCRERV